MVAGESDDTGFQLQNAVDQYLDAAGTAVTQAVVDARNGGDATGLKRAGYRYLADLDYLISFLDSFPQERPVSELQFRSLPTDDERRLESLVQRTYIGSLDCPQLGGSRRIEDVLRGYRETAVYRHDWWLVATHNDQDVGCVLLADHPDYNQCELIYLGIVPETRGRGWGFQATRYAQWLMRTAARQRMLLALDAANWPAHRMYLAAGFDSWDRRSVYVRTAASRSAELD